MPERAARAAFSANFKSGFTQLLLKSLNEPASADLRINRGTRESVLQKLRGEGLFFAPTPYSPIGIRSSERVNLNNCIAYKEGEVEVQDEASQLAAILCDVKPEHKIVDYCAGAGGFSGEAV